jgi:hypothetical protein
LSIEDKDRDDVMERLLELGGDKKYLTFDDLNRELPDNVVSPDDIEDVLQKLEGSNIPVADSDERLLEQAAASPSTKKKPTKMSNSISPPARSKKPTIRFVLYLREMGVVPLLTREGEVAIAKRIERGQLKTQKAIARSPIAVKELLKIGEELEAAKSTFARPSPFSEQAELTGEEDKAEEYRDLDHRRHSEHRKLFKQGLKEWENFATEQKATRAARRARKLTAPARKVARLRLEIAQEIGRLNLPNARASV